MAFLSISSVCAHENATDSLDSPNDEVRLEIGDCPNNQNSDNKYPINNSEVLSDGENNPTTSKIEPEIDVYGTTDNVRFIFAKSNSFRYGMEYAIAISAPADSTGVPTITIDGQNCTANNYSSEYYRVFYIDGLNLKVGPHNITGIFPGDEKYLPETKTINLEIRSAIVMPFELEFNDTLKITLYTSDDAKGNLTVLIDGNFINSTNVLNGEAAIEINDLTIGEHEVNAFYTGDDYNVQSINTTMQITPAFIYPETVMEHNNDTIFVIMKPDTKGNVSFVYGKTITKPLIDGKANFSLSNLTNNIIESGSEYYLIAPAEFEIVYPGEDNKTYRKSFSIQVNPYPPKIINNTDFIKTYGEDKTFSVTVIDENANPPKVRTGYRVYININDSFNMYKTLNNNGTVSFKITDEGYYGSHFNEVPGEYNLTISCLGTEVTYKLIIKTTNTSIDVNPITTGYYNKQMQFRANINPSATSGEIEVYADSSFLTKAKVKNGTATFKYTPKKIGTVKFKVIYKGNEYYDSSLKEFKVTVKKATTTITASAATFKATTKTKKYDVTLKANGKALANKKLTLTVKGKTYTATTNSQGKATFKITKLTKKGTHTATIKFAGNSYYNKATKTVKLKIK